MREPFRRVVRAAAMLAGLGMLSLAAAAQQAKPPVKVPDNIIGNEHPAPEPPGGPPPHAADGFAARLESRRSTRAPERNQAEGEAEAATKIFPFNLGPQPRSRL
jgi:hypothetical protein